MQQSNLISNIQHLIQKHSVAMVDLAQKLSIPPAAVEKLKLGELSNPSANMLIGLSEYFEVSLDKLVFDKLA